LEALVEGKIQAHTDAQLRFIAVDEKQLKPETSFEIAWMKLKGRRDFERFKDSSEEAPKQSGYCSCCHRQLSNKPINRSCPECMKSRSHMPQPSGNDWDHWDYSAIK
jgi:rubrerythrin